nr:MAG TPA: hypothetical protein [Caudoviricetes sp.]
MDNIELIFIFFQTISPHNSGLSLSPILSLDVLVQLV